MVNDVILSSGLCVGAYIDKVVNKEGSHLKAYATISIHGTFSVHGIQILESEKGLFVKMPQRPIKQAEGENEYTDVFHPTTAEARKILNNIVLKAYAEKVKQLELPGEKDHAAKAAPTHKARRSAPGR
ncbi:MAG: SpoVG family protein [Oscillospiraceae bacterium]|nr:SpoVG family protein [Oscillospiraceae bacterium]MBR6861746.1 SpoVG family protein [Acidaminococcaceae bacterium]